MVFVKYPGTDFFKHAELQLTGIIEGVPDQSQVAFDDGLVVIVDKFTLKDDPVYQVGDKVTKIWAEGSPYRGSSSVPGGEPSPYECQGTVTEVTWVGAEPLYGVRWQPWTIHDDDNT